MNDSLISVLMSVFNETIDQVSEAVNSIINQTYKNIELIVIVDNPNYEEVIAFLKALAKKDQRVVFFVNSRNIGLAESMNEAAAMARGTFFARMDADDISDAKRLETQIKVLEDKNVDFVFSNYTLIDEHSNRISDNLAGRYSQGKELLKEILFKSIIHHPTVLFRKDVFLRAGGYRNFPCSQDLDLWLRMVEQGTSFEMINKPLLKYRIREGSVSNRKKMQQYLTINYIRYLQYERAKKNADSYSVENYIKYLNRFKYQNARINKKFIQTNLKLRKSKDYGAIKKNIYRLLIVLSDPTYRKTILNGYLQRKKVIKWLVSKGVL